MHRTRQKNYKLCCLRAWLRWSLPVSTVQGVLPPRRPGAGAVERRHHRRPLATTCRCPTFPTPHNCSTCLLDGAVWHQSWQCALALARVMTAWSGAQSQCGPTCSCPSPSAGCAHTRRPCHHLCPPYTHCSKKGHGEAMLLLQLKACCSSPAPTRMPLSRPWPASAHSRSRCASAHSRSRCTSAHSRSRCTSAHSRSRCTDVLTRRHTAYFTTSSPHLSRFLPVCSLSQLCLNRKLHEPVTVPAPLDLSTPGAGAGQKVRAHPTVVPVPRGDRGAVNGIKGQRFLTSSVGPRALPHSLARNPNAPAPRPSPLCPMSLDRKGPVGQRGSPPNTLHAHALTITASSPVATSNRAGAGHQRAPYHTMTPLHQDTGTVRPCLLLFNVT